MRLLGNYELKALLGESSFGSVYAGIDRKIGRKVAIKILKLSDLPSEQAAVSYATKVFHDHRHLGSAMGRGRLAAYYKLQQASKSVQV
jgi:serine/threonine protein kinase